MCLLGDSPLQNATKCYNQDNAAAAADYRKGRGPQNLVNGRPCDTVKSCATPGGRSVPARRRAKRSQTRAGAAVWISRPSGDGNRGYRNCAAPAADTSASTDLMIRSWSSFTSPLLLGGMPFIMTEKAYHWPSRARR